MSYNKNKKRKSFNVHLIRFLCSVGGTDKVLMVSLCIFFFIYLSLLYI